MREQLLDLYDMDYGILNPLQPTGQGDQNPDFSAALAFRPVPVPTVSPVIDVVSTYGTTIVVKVHQATEGPKTPTGKPEGVKGAALFWFVGENPPADPTLYHFAINTTKNVVNVVLPPLTEPGAKVWLTAFWFNNRMQSGPAASAVSIHIPGTMAAAA
jgi:hypothetical protein